MHGTCKGGECICKPGYYGDRCDQKGCTNQCSGTGLCFEPADDTAQCLCLHGTFGLDCSESGCARGCRHGKCVMTPSGTVHCKCDPGWAGEDCGTRVCSPCVNGHCDGVRCVCEPGYTGVDCSLRECPDCGARGVCDPLTGTCVCHKPFFNRPGATPNCMGNEEVCPNRCTSPSHGICLAEGCKCLEGWGGKDCSEIRCPNDCSGNGVCKLGKCYCNEGFSGTDCSEKKCPNQCSGRGLCVDGKCKCLQAGAVEALKQLGTSNPKIVAAIAQPENVTVPTGVPSDIHSPSVRETFFKPLPLVYVDAGFGGYDCEKRFCATSCGAEEGRGECDHVTGTCRCKPGFYWNKQGKDCSLKLCDRTCSGNGLCVEGVCRCVEGFTGPECEQPVEQLPASSQIFIEQSAEATQTLEAEAEMAAHAQQVLEAKLEIEQLIAESERRETLAAYEAVRQDLEAARAVLHESDEAVVNMYLKHFASRSAAFVQVLAIAESQAAAHSNEEGLLATIAEDSAAAPNATAPKAALTEAAKATRARYDEEQAQLSKLKEVIKSEIGPQGKGCVADCSGRGVCQNGKCLCTDSTGDHCQFRTCPANCSNNGKCDETTGKCMCLPGYTGEACEQLDCVPKDCNGHGTCVRNETKVPFCRCEKGWIGPKCDVELCPRDCSGRGLCVKGKCYCNAGFRGDNCEEGPVCEAPGCGPHGKCIAISDGRVGCACEEGWTGQLCDKPTCTSSMVVTTLPNGTYVHVSGTGPKCGAHGVCISNKCICEIGYEGEFCEYRNDCKPGCVAGQGVCKSDEKGNPVCVCKPGFGGPDCGGKVCDKDCNGRGICLDGKCHCEKGWSGENCELGCKNNCNNRGKCVPDPKSGAPTCQCNPPFYLDDCHKGRCPGALFSPTGAQSFCSGHGTCDTSTGVCKCEPGFTGAGCETFSAAECRDACKKRCKSGRPGAFKLEDPLTGQVQLMLTSVCSKRCDEKCKLSIPK